MSNTHPNARKIRRVALMSLLLGSVGLQAETLVITDQTVPMTLSSDARVILLDDLQQFEDQLSEEISTARHQTPETTQRNISSTAGRNLQNGLVQAHQGVTDAWSLGIIKIPAVVVDRRYVIYGETDVAKAIERINQFRSLSQ